MKRKSKREGGTTKKREEEEKHKPEESEHKKNERVILMTTKAKKLYTEFVFKKNDTILFGRESSGVPEKVHNKISLKLKIPMIKKYRSLNLSTSVSILLSENLKTVSNFLKVVETKQFEKFLNFDGIGETQINSFK